MLPRTNLQVEDEQHHAKEGATAAKLRASMELLKGSKKLAKYFRECVLESARSRNPLVRKPSLDPWFTSPNGDYEENVF